MVSFLEDLTRGEATSELTHMVVTVVCYLVSHVQLFETPWTVATRILCPWDFSGKSHYHHLGAITFLTLICWKYLHILYK